MKIGLGEFVTLNSQARAKRAMKEDKSVRQVALEMQLLPEEELARLLDLMAMTKPGL